jgi:hypothetical protein
LSYTNAFSTEKPVKIKVDQEPEKKSRRLPGKIVFGLLISFILIVSTVCIVKCIVQIDVDLENRLKDIENKVSVVFDKVQSLKERLMSLEIIVEKKKKLKQL